MTPEEAAALRKPFNPKEIGKLPRGGTQLDYVGHAGITNRLLEVDSEWYWEPIAFTENGLPFIKIQGTDAVLWIKLTICGVTRLGCGTVASNSFDVEKQLIGDALRNAAMRFGVALDLWSKEELHLSEDQEALTAPQSPPKAAPKKSKAKTPPKATPPSEKPSAALEGDPVEDIVDTGGRTLPELLGAMRVQKPAIDDLKVEGLMPFPDKGTEEWNVAATIILGHIAVEESAA